MNDGMGSENYFLILNSMEKPKVTDLQTESLLLDATLVAAFAPLAAMFFPLVALLDAANDRDSAQPGLSPVVLPPPPLGFVLGGNGFCLGRCRCDFLMGALMVAAIEEKTAGLVPGSDTDLPKELSEPGSGCEADFHEELGGGQVWRHAHPVGFGHVPLFQQTKFCLVGSGNDVSGKSHSPCGLGENAHDVDALRNRVLDGVFTVLSEVDQGSCGIGSCTVASVETAHLAAAAA